ncbi:murein biosynthesis integral membrane protein MurJ [Virgibacillus sp. L01]|uniref:murein biosynthesis integral membrane protein MurJ n=1 Tax=Virgibacillus sp. L01 TaxID=3457429 RepID=UPI003FD076F4
MKYNIGLASILFLIATLFLKISGLIRDMVIAYYFGDSYVADAYLAAYIIPNMIILFFTTGMKNAFVPSYIQSIEDNRGIHHLSQVFKGTILISITLSLVGIVLSKYYIPILFPEFNDHGQQIAVWTTIILFSSMLFVGMNSVLEALFDSRNEFSLSVVSQITVVGSTILSAILFEEEIGAYSLAVGYLAGTIISFLFKLFIVMPRKIINFKEKINWAEIKGFYIIFIPVALTVAVGQINLAVDNIFASYFEAGAVTYINYAKNLVHFPQAIFGVTIGTIIFPLLSKANAKNDQVLFKRGIEQGLTTMFFILLPSIIGMMVLMPNIIELLYQRGAFGSDATLATSRVAYYYFGSVLFFSLHNVINKGFYILKKGHLILMIGGMAILLNIILNYIFTTWIGYTGIPLASSIMAFFYVGTCFIIFLRLVKDFKLKNIGLEYLKIIIAVLVMSVVVLGLNPLVKGWSNIVHILTISIIGAAVYLLCVILLRSKTLAIFVDRFIRKTKEKDSSSGM